MRVLAAVLTYNRCALLSRCLDHLLTQRRPPDAIVVINNASSDGTVEMLQRRHIPFVTQENLGSAGGWHRAISYAMEYGFDAVWLMDDDGFPALPALEKLCENLTAGVACASSVVVCEDSPERFVFPFPLLNSQKLPVALARQRKFFRLAELRRIAPQGTYPFAHFFNGALVSIAAARVVGNVDQSFYIFGDEVDYFFRLRSAGAVISVLDALHYHPDVNQRPYSSAKIYYYVKNSLVLNRRYFDAVWLRNGAVVLIALVRTARRNGLSAAASLLFGKSAPMFYSAIQRGLRDQLGRDFNG
jgi:rhamnopyranosyl-N-acetylglucosaminyl-diphospho-decaprenol beta-1,3/1,4-galactofuranosyltransferase